MLQDKKALGVHPQRLFLWPPQASNSQSLRSQIGLGVATCREFSWEGIPYELLRESSASAFDALLTAVFFAATVLAARVAAAIAAVILTAAVVVVVVVAAVLAVFMS